MQYCFDLFLRRGSISGSDLINICDSQLGFKPTRLNFKKITKKNSLVASQIEELIRKDENVRFDSTEENTGVFHFWRKKNDYLSWISDGSIPSMEFLNGFIKKSEFLCLYIYDLSFVQFQNETKVNNYRAFGKKYEHLKLYRDIDGEELIDVSENPGRSFFSQELGIDILPAWKMWLSKEARTYFRGKPIEQFPLLFEFEKLENDVYYICLYPKIEDSELEKNLNIMREYRQWCSLDNAGQLSQTTSKEISQEESEQLLKEIQVINRKFRGAD